MSDNRPQSPRTLTQARQELQAARARVAELEAQLSENHRDLAARLTGEGYRRTLDNLLEGCQIFGFDWRYLYINDAGARYGRQPKEVLLGSTLMERYPGIEKTELFAALEHCMNERTAQDADFEFAYPDGRHAWLEFRIQPVPEGLLVLTLDITERRLDEVVLHVSEERFRSLFEHMLNGFAYCKMVYEQGRPQDFIYLDVNLAFETLTGLKNVVGKKVSEVIPGLHESDPELFEIYGRVALTGQPETFETYVQALAMWFSISVYSPASEYFVAVFDVITDRKRAEKALAEERALLRTLIDNLPARVYAKDAAGRFVVRNAVDTRLMGAASSDEVIGKTVFDYYPRELAEQFDADDQAVIQSGQPLIDRQERVKNADGTQGWLLTSKVPLRDAQGKVIGLVGVSHDITRRRQAEQQIQKLNRTLAVLSDVNQAIVRVREMPALFEVICHIAVERGELRMAWVGLLDPETRRVNPIAQAGGAKDYLDSLDIVPDDKLRGRGPTAIAVRTRGYVVCNDIEHDPRMVASREDALRLGYRALVAFPLTVAGEVRGVFSLYAAETDFFDDQELRLLDEMASDISFAMEFAEQEEQRQKAEAGLKRYAQRLELLHEIDTGIIGARSIQDLADSALKRLRQLIPCQRVSVGLIDQANGERIIFSVDLEGPSALEKGLRVPTPPDWYEQFSDGSIRATRDLRLLQGPSPTQIQLIKEGLVSSLQALLMAQGQPIGTLNLLADTPDYFTTEHEEIVAQVANQLAVAIRQLHLSEELAHHSTQLEQKVTERTAELQAAKEHVEAILNNSLDGILLVHPDLRIEQTNRAFHTLFGCTADDGLNLSLLDFISADDAHRVEALIQTALREQVGRQIEMRGRRKDGTTFDAELSVGTVRDDGLVCTIRDITERKQAELALKAKVEEEREFQRYLKELHLITIELAQVDQLDEFHKRVVQLGLERLGFERLALFLRDAEHGGSIGTYGTDAQGRLTDERQFRMAATENDIQQRALQRIERFCVDEDTQLYTNGAITGRGWNAAAVLWNGTQGLGWLVADNEIHHRPASKPLMDTLALYSLAVGTLLTRKQAETALRASEEKFRSLMEAAPEAIVISDRQGSITLLNVEAENMFGYKREELLGQNISILVPEALREGHERYQAAFVSAPSSRAMGKGRILPARSKDGREFQVDVSLSHIHTPDDVLVMSVVTDITERKRAEEALRESEARYRSVIEVATDQILLIDTQGTILMVNPAALRDSNYSRDEMQGHGLAEFLTPESQSDFLREFPSLLRFGANRQELGFVHKDGSIAILDCSASVVYDKDRRPQSITVVQRDVTKRRQVEEALFQALEREKELNELKSQFVSMASHEFRTPLATILTLTETLSAYRPRMTEPQIDQRLGKIKEQVGHLKDIMEDVLQLARMQARRVEFSPVLLDLDSLCRSVIDEFQSQPNIAHQLLYTCHTALRQVKLDKKLMRQIINNLVSNAIKYSPDGKPVTISLDHTGEALELKVRDEGIGIPEADLRHLYEPFHRASNVGTIPGTGLGLVITRESVALHGGDISVESQVGAGTTFTVSIPIMVEGEQGHDEDPGD